MDKRTWAMAVIAVAAAVSCGRLAWFERDQARNEKTRTEFVQKRLALAAADNERLRALLADYEKARHGAAHAGQKKEIERATSRIRGLSFKTPVVYDVVTRQGIKKVLLEKLSDQYGDAEFESARLGYVALGLIPADYPLKERYVDLLGEQVAAFYDQHSHRLFMFEDAALDSLQNQVILSHELTHALQDQHFGLARLPLEIKNNDDRALAASALVEGDATLEMNQYMVEHFSWAGLGSQMAGIFTQSLEQLQAAPRILRESLLFPYTAGLQFCTVLQARDGGFSGVSAAYARLPASTSQILHPEKYFAGEQPIPVEWPDTAALGEKPLVDNVLGELGTRILLSDWTEEATATAVASGWRGDRYLVFDKGRALLWRTLWGTPQEATRFAEAATRMLARRYGAKPEPHAHGMAEGEVRFDAPGRHLRLVTVHSNEVVLVDAGDERWASALAGKFGQ